MREAVAGLYRERHGADLDPRRVLITVGARAPDGAFYACCDVSGTGLDAWTFCERVLEEARVALTPGLDYGPATGDTHVRLSYAVGGDEPAEGLERLGGFVAGF